MPGDVTGSLVYDARTAEFSFRPGPVFTNLLLADEINRTPPKTQASLLEAMEERQVSRRGRAPAAARPVRRGRNAEPDRVRGHLPAAGGAARPLPAQADRAAAAAGRGVRGAQQRTTAASTRATWPAPACARSPTPATSPPARAQCAVCRSPRRCWATSSTCAGRRGSRRRCRSASHRAARPRCWHGEGVGVAVGPGLRHPRRREGAGPADAAAPGRSSGPRPSSRASPPTACSTASSRRCRSPR